MPVVFAAIVLKDYYFGLILPDPCSGPIQDGSLMALNIDFDQTYPW